MAFAHKSAKSKERELSEPTRPTDPATLAMVGAVLLTPSELAQRLAVPTSWVREKTRERARIRDRDPLPVKRLGKYVRFDWKEIEEWLKRQ